MGSVRNEASSEWRAADPQMRFIKKKSLETGQSPVVGSSPFHGIGNEKRPYMDRGLANFRVARQNEAAICEGSPKIH
jgi:hypothetical protein